LPVGVTICPQARACDPTQTQFWSVLSQSVFGVDGPKTTIPSSDWVWADCRKVAVRNLRRELDALYNRVVKIIRTDCAEHPAISDSVD
jgi:hypothetical protein